MRFVSDHDENWPFFFFHLGISVVLSVFFNLGYFLVLILIHFFLDFLKHWHSENKRTNRVRHALFYAFRDAFLLDFFLLVVAFAFGFVFHFTFAIALANSTRLLRFVELGEALRLASRIVLADWLLAHISWLSTYVREMDSKKIFMHPKMARHEVMLVAGTLIIIGVTIALPLVFVSDFETLVHYANHELIPRIHHLQ